MVRLRIVVSVGVLALILSLMPTEALAQNTGIAGVVRDTSGAMMPGATVEAASPVLIEKVRSVVTNDQGLYSIVDLRPGTYSVTFSLPGFSTVRREGIQLAGSSMATVNVELQVGAIEETLTVTGEAPSVDTRNVVQRTVMSDEVREALPTGRSVLFIATLIPGTTRSANVGKVRDLAGTSGTRGGSMIHGGRVNDYMLQYDGTPTDLGGGGSNQSWQSDPGEVQEFVYQLGALSAELPFGGVAANIIPKDGGNRFSGRAFYAFTGGGLQSDNVTQELRDLGVQEPANLQKNWDANMSGGGPIVRDKLWFFGSYRNNGGNEYIVGAHEAIDARSFVYDPARGVAGNVDLTRPVVYPDRNYYYSGRLTWQATQKNKIAVYGSTQARHNYLRSVSGTVSAESGQNQEFGDNFFKKGGCGGEGCGFTGLLQISWKSPLTSKLLIEANYGHSPQNGCRCPPFGDQAHLYAGPDVVSVIDTVTGYEYRAASGGYDFDSWWNHDSAKVALSYVSGAHAMKFGADLDWGGSGINGQFHNNRNMTFRFQNGVPNQITVFNEPYDQNSGQFRRQGVFAQDQWTVRRLTANVGLRLDYHQGSIPDGQTSGPNAYAPLTHWPGVKNVPNWKDLSPRFGVAYDLFGNGKTAVKYTLSRYVNNDGTAFPASVNPLTFNRSATRSWDDRRACAGGILNDYVPQECELGTLSNTAFGTTLTTTTIDDAIREGWGVRQNNWETAASVQHQLFSDLSVAFAYTRRWYNNFTVTDNRAVGPADYDEFCVTAPSDARLGDVSGSRICGLYDITAAARVRRPDNLRTTAENFGEQREYWEGIDLTMSARLGGRATVQGGLNSGTEGNRTEACFVIDSPGTLRFCDVRRPWRSNVRFLGSIELPWGINTGVTFVADPNVEILANYSVTNADITAGRVQFVNPARTTFSGGNSTVALISPGTKFQEVIYQVDVRLSKSIRYRGTGIRLSLDLANLNNSSAVLAHSNTYGGNWLRPDNVMPGRLLKPGVQIEW